MLVKILGALDLIGGILLFLISSNINIPNKILFVFGFILILKSLLGFFKDFASWIDFLSGAVLVISIFGGGLQLISVIMAILLIQKGIFSFI